jgi:hypothetical protein
LLTLLSGYAEDSKLLRLKEDFSPYWKVNKNKYFDDLPVIWKNFSQKGYATLYSEDDPMLNIFHFLNKNGFEKQPTDYYMRPFWLAAHLQKQFASKDKRCYAHVPKHRILFNYTRDFVFMAQKEKLPYFALTVASQISHGYIYEVKVTLNYFKKYENFTKFGIDMQILDEDFTKLMQDLLSKGAFDNTVVLILGDHGNRYDNFRLTSQGRVEDRMPLLGIKLPDSLKHFKENILHNSNVLTSWYDVHEFLQDIASGKIDKLPKKVSVESIF